MCRLIVREQDFDPSKAGIRGSPEAIEEGDFLEQPGEIGIESVALGR